MLIMTYAHARASGDDSLITKYVRTKLVLSIFGELTKPEQYSLLTSWAEYLSNATLSINEQCVHYLDDFFANNLDDRSSADGLTADNQTNLAIKGIIAIKAMSKMSSILNRSADVDKYSVRTDHLDDA